MKFTNDPTIQKKIAFVDAVRACREDISKGLGELDAALPSKWLVEIDIDVAMLRAIDAHTELSRALAMLERVIPSDSLRVVRSRRNEPGQTLIEEALAALAQPGQLNTIARGKISRMMGLSKLASSEVKDYVVCGTPESLIEFARAHGPLRVMAHFAPFSIKDFAKLGGVGPKVADEIRAIFLQYGVSIK